MLDRLLAGGWDVVVEESGEQGNRAERLWSRSL